MALSEKNPILAAEWNTLIARVKAEMDRRNRTTGDIRSADPVGAMAYQNAVQQIQIKSENFNSGGGSITDSS